MNDITKFPLGAEEPVATRATVDELARLRGHAEQHRLAHADEQQRERDVQAEEVARDAAEAKAAEQVDELLVGAEVCRARGNRNFVTGTIKGLLLGAALVGGGALVIAIVRGIARK